jgi:diguanylate cyclase
VPSEQRPFSTFDEAATAVLEHLQGRYPLMLWMVTRTEGENWIILSAAGRGYGVGAGDVFRWTDTFCSRMVEQGAPRVAPSSADVPLYAMAPISSEMDIGAYMGTPLNDATGELFGTLCAIDPNPQPPQLAAAEDELELLGRLLSTVLAREMLSEERQREVERAGIASECDELTGVGNRRFWDGIVTAEEMRCARYGHSATVISVRLGGEPNDLQRRTAGAVVAAAVRPDDAVARIGDDELAVLAVECPADEGEALAERVRIALADGGVQATVGWAARDHRATLYDALAQART